MRIYVTARFKADENKADIEQLCSAVRAAGFEDFCFIRDVESYQRGVFATPEQLMERAREELLRCDALLIDVSDNPGGGRVVEAGIAFGHGKPVIVIAKQGTQIGVPMQGIAATIIEYEVLDDIVTPLMHFVRAATSADV